MTLIYRDQRLDVQLGASTAHPHGRVVSLPQGWVDVDDSDIELVGHPVVRSLLPKDAAAAKRLVALRGAAVARDEAIAKAHADYAATIRKLADGDAKLAASAAADWEKRREAATKDGEEFTEPHPDPDQARAAALTAPAPTSMTTTAAVRQIDTPDGGDQASRKVVEPTKAKNA
jgi:hypothetical protein